MLKCNCIYECVCHFVHLLERLGHCASGAVNVLATIVAIVVVDRGGRKLLFLEGGIQMALAEIALAGLIAWNFRAGAGPMTSGVRRCVSAVLAVLTLHNPNHAACMCGSTASISARALGP